MARNHSFLVAAMRGPVDSVPSPPPSKAAFVETKEARFEYRSISDSSKESSQNLGLKVVYEPPNVKYGEEPEFDIVAVHGLLERPEDTWTWPSQVNDGAPDKYQSFLQHGISDIVQDTLEKTGLQTRGHQQQIRSGEGAKRSRRGRKQRKVNWLADQSMLPKSFPDARIMRFDYGWKQRSDSLEVRTKSAKRLLNALAEDRKNSLKFPPRPILFIGHSFGGVVIQTALMLAEQEKNVSHVPQSDDYFLKWLSQKEIRGEILKATVGVIFLATPFKITSSIRDRWRGVGVDLYNPKSGQSSSGPKVSESTTTKHDQPDNINSPDIASPETLDAFNSEFLQTALEEQFRLACFYEKHHYSSKTRSTTTFLDEDSSTLPGYPKVPLLTNHTDMSKYPNQHDRRFCVVVDAIRGFLAFAPTRHLWKAVDVGRIRTVQMMLDLGADPNLQDIGGESALHKAARSRGTGTRVIETLLAGGADIHQKNAKHKTALSIAEIEGRDDIARLLRKHGATLQFWDMKKAGNVYPLDKIYMDGPSHASNAERRWDLDSLDFNCEAACRQSIISITHFSRSNGRSLDRYRLKASVFDALYDESLSSEIIETALLRYQKEHNMETRQSMFTWYHLPANNMAWIEKLFMVLFKRWFERDIDEALRALRLLSGEQHKLNNSNFLYMRPDCRPVELKFACKKEGDRANKFENEKRTALKLFMPYLHYEKSINQALMRKHMDQSTSSYDRQVAFKRRPSETTIPISLSRQSTTEISSSSSNLESESDLEPEATQGNGPVPDSEPEAGLFGDFITNCMSDPPEPYLISGYLNKEPPLHMRRSLDQFYSISKLDELIGYLDMDQVVYKHFEKKSLKNGKAQKKPGSSENWETETIQSEATSSDVKSASESTPSQAFKELIQKWDKEIRSPQDCPIVIVDQLWLWIIDGDTIITSFPQGSEPSPNGILERIEEKLQGSEVKVIGDLAGLIIDECAGFLDRCRAPANLAILDIYDETISDAMKQQVEFFDRFTEMVLMSAVKDEYRNLKKVGKHYGMEDQLLSYGKGSKFLSPDFDQHSLSIIEEAELLREIRDAKEELNIIKRILGQQERVIVHGLKAMVSKDKDSEAVKKFNSHASSDTPQLLENCRRNHEENANMINATIQNSVRSVNSMLERADEVCDGLKTLLDLKQKEINVREARATRQIAEGNEKQSKIILIFTIVTIVFMPLSFLASFFALNSDQFPRSIGGSTEFSLPWVAGLIFGVTAAFVVPFVIGAFFFVAPGGREQARNWLYQLLKMAWYPLGRLDTALRKQTVSTAQRRTKKIDLESWDPVDLDFDPETAPISWEPLKRD